MTAYEQLARDVAPHLSDTDMAEFAASLRRWHLRIHNAIDWPQDRLDALEQRIIDALAE